MHALKKVLFLILALFLVGISTAIVAKNMDDLSPAELVAIAMTLNNQARYTEAADLLERALLLNPDIPSGLIEYQKALAGTQGGRKVKEATLDLASLLEADWTVNKQAYVKVGASDNLNRALTSSVIPITLAGQTINVSLADDERPKSGEALELGLALGAYSRLSSTVELTASAEILQRKATQTGYTNYQWGKLAASWGETLPGNHSIVWGATADILNYKQQRPYYVLQGMMRYGFSPKQQCTPQMGIDIKHQGQQKNKALEGRYLGAVVALNCHKKNQAYTVQVSLGQNWANNERLGGDQKKARLQISHQWAAGELIQGDELRTTASYFRQQDQGGYSLSLNNGRKRSIKRIDVSVEYAWPLRTFGKNWQGFVSVDWIRQESNIVLFETNAQEVWFGLRANW